MSSRFRAVSLCSILLLIAAAAIVAAGSVVTLTVNLSEAVTVAGGTPTLTLNDGGTATYTGGTGTTALTFSYTVGAGQNTADLTVTAIGDQWRPYRSLGTWYMWRVLDPLPNAY